jgi:hypothetical protein
MPGTTIRIREETREALRQIERQTGEGTQELLSRAVEQLRRSLILGESNAAYARIRAAGAEDDKREWEATLADGLADD